MVYSLSPSPSPVSPSPAASDSSVDDISALSEVADGLGPSASRPGSPSAREAIFEEEDSVTCQWDDCGIVFTHLPTLISHIHNDHIGVHKSNYTCEWSTCQRRGLAQTSRFALISHIRSHTGEKPFTCARPECDKSFTRSDALAKHMRLQHNISPPAPGRGGSRKRKRPADDYHSSVPAPSQPHTPTGITGSSFNTFKVESRATSELFDDDQYPFINGGTPHSPPTPPRRGSLLPDDDEGYTSSEDTLPPHLLAHLDPETNLILGRSSEMVQYLLMKSKHRYALQQHEELLEELRVTRNLLNKAKEAKEEAVDKVLRKCFGPQAEEFIKPIPVPQSLVPSTTLPLSSPAQLANGAS